MKQIHPEPIEVESSTVAEAIKIVTNQLPGFRPDAINGRRRVQVSGCHTVDALFVPSEIEEIHLRPAFVGGKGGGFVQMAIGAVLVAASFIDPEPITKSILLSAGITMFLGGVLQLIQQPPRDLGDPATVKSHYLGQPGNTTAIGTRIPVLYGQRNVAGHYLSFNIAAIDVGV